MSITLTARQHAALLFLSASGYIAWLSGLGGRLEAQDLAPGRPATFTIVEAGPAPRVADVIRRDPFAGKPRTDARQQSAATTDGTTAAVGKAAPDAATAIASGGAPGDLAVPNIGDEPGTVAQPPTAMLTLALRATIVGPNPVAYVENGTVMDIVRVGDALGDRRIAKIDLRGIAFGDGTRLDLPETQMSPVPLTAGTPAPRAATPRTLTLEDLRRLLATRTKAEAQPSALPASLSSPSAASDPSPGPLPTIDTRGLPVGVNPTSNPEAPTPFPYPYPYAPPAPSQ